MSKYRKIQANYRLPEGLLDELREVAEEVDMSQSLIVRTGIEEKISKLRSQIKRKKAERQAEITA